MRTRAPQRTKEERTIDHANRESRSRCKCAHYHARACGSQLANISLSDAFLRNEKCYCLCHLDDDGQQVILAVWQCRRKVEVVA